MSKIKYLVLVFFMTFSLPFFAQQTQCSQKSEIVMTKTELKELLQNVIKAKKAKIAREKALEHKIALAEAKIYYYENKLRQLSYMSYQPNFNGHNFKENPSKLAELEAKLDYLLGRMNTTDSRVVTTPSENYQKDKYTDEKQSQIVVPNNERHFSDLKSQISLLQKKLSQASPSERRSLLRDLLDRYGNFKKQVFFGNNSKKVSSSDVNYISDVAEILRKHKELSVVLEGYASPVGSATYNKKLSMQRAEAVQVVLERQGISRDRILPAFKGEDHSGSHAHSRRVDMSIVIR